jgi:predicted ABC-type ATPase
LSTQRPRLFVLAGVNGAGKSSLGGFHLERHGIGPDDWFNPDAAARILVGAGLPPAEANIEAWQIGRGLLEAAIAELRPHAFETTLGGNTIPSLIRTACQTHEVRMWFCGLDSPDRHVRRVRERVMRGGHDIPEVKIRARYDSAVLNLIALMPGLAELKVFDNSVDAVGGCIPDPVLVLHVEGGRVRLPVSDDELAATPGWAMAIVEAALELEER